MSHMTTSVSSSQLRPPRISFRKNLGADKQSAPSLPPKKQVVPSTAKKLPIVGISA